MSSSSSASATVKESDSDIKLALPIYDILAEKLNRKVSQGNFSINSNYRSKLNQILNSAKPQNGEQIALLLIHYYFLTHPNEKTFGTGNTLPFGIKISPSGQGFSFELDSLENSFQALLGTYCGL